MAKGTICRTDLVYFGTPRRYDPRHDHSRIDPSLEVDSRGDPAGITLDYAPSYRGLDPRARATYLQWLDGGRTNRNTPIGYVFLFFYGLEQRLFVDEARGEAATILNEVRRLLDIYGSDHSFESYASKLCALSVLFEGEDHAPLTAAGARNYELEIPIDVRVRLGRTLRDKGVFEAEDALRWVCALPDVYLRTPAERCFAELRELWARRFVAKHPEGLAVRQPKKALQHHYIAASGTFSVDVSLGDLPDISGITAPLAPLRTMLDGCTEDLSAYSRLIGREPDARSMLRADLLLPADLRHDRTSLSSCRERLGLLAASPGLASTTAKELAVTLGIAIEPGAPKLSATVTRQMWRALDALDYGCEPDRRYGPAGALRVDAPLSLFACPGGGAVEHERSSYAEARITVEVAMLAAVADGEVCRSELAVTERRLRAIPELADTDVARLMAYGKALAADPPKVRSALKRLAEVPPAARSALASLALEAVLADGRIDPEEVKFLEVLHAALGLPASELYAALHRGTDMEDAGPVLVAAAGTDIVIPFPPATATPGAITIDSERLARIRAETSKVSALLGSIFVEDEPIAPPPRPRVVASTAFPGLDGPHSELLGKLLAGPVERAAFDALAAELRLMPDGAIEAINEWGFDRFDEPMIEDDMDAISVVPHIAEHLTLEGLAA